MSFIISSEEADFSLLLHANLEQALAYFFSINPKQASLFLRANLQFY